MLHAFSRRWTAAEYLVGAYLLVIIIYPYRASGLRFFFPILPFLLHYMLVGLGLLVQLERWKQAIAAGVILIALGFAAEASYRDFATYEDSPFWGPQMPHSQEAFSFIQEETKPNDGIVFFKPRVLALYTGRKGFSLSIHESAAETARQMDQVGANYILMHKDLPNGSLDRFLAEKPERVEKLFQNSHFRLFRIN